ncbi:MAG: winged helix-turn-helix domain-containing protein [Acidobacteriota bacterium]|nr:winged helix-turn-helix domain-containing protein [Acidobacteriota bacterium]
MDKGKDKQINEFYDFDSFRVDVKKRRLMRESEVVPLTPKEFEVLLLLVENAGRIVEKDELLEKVWKNAFVEEGTVARNISWLRKKLDANGGNGTKIIETLPKRGYRFLPEVTGIGKNDIVIEEQIVQQIQIEEIVGFLPASNRNENVAAHSEILQSQPTVISNENRKALSAPNEKRRISPFWIVPALLILMAVVFFAYRAYFSQNQPRLLLASKTVPFSGLPGRENSPAFSPDGKQMVFSWDGGIEGGNSDIYVKLIGAGEPVRLTSSEAEEINPVFSPDGKSVVFLRIFPTHNEIILIPALGGAERKIYDKASYASFSFSPDGNFLATSEHDLSKNKPGIFTINLQTGEKTMLTAPDAPIVDHTARFSPDGKHLAFIRHFSTFRREIFIIPAEGGDPRQITADDVRIYGLAWNTDSRRLFFTSFRVANQLNLWQVSLNGDEPQMISTGSKNLSDIAISPDGKNVAFVEEIVDENIWEIEPNARPRPLVRSTRADHSQQFSPDGAKIAFASERTGNYEIWIADADGKNQRQLTNSSSSAGSPRFSSDGKFILYDAQTPNGSDIYIISVNGGEPRRLTQDGKNNSLAIWSIDGNWIFFLSNRGDGNQIWKMPASGGEPVKITKHGAFEMFAAPNGKEIIYSKGGGKTGLWSVGTNGNDEKPIPELADAGGWRSWFVSANGVYYTTFAFQPPFSVKFFDFAARQTKVVTKVDKPPLNYYANLCVSPDEKKILYARQDQSASTIMLAELDSKSF